MAHQPAVGSGRHWRHQQGLEARVVAVLLLAQLGARIGAPEHLRRRVHGAAIRAGQHLAHRQLEAPHLLANLAGLGLAGGRQQPLVGAIGVAGHARVVARKVGGGVAKEDDISKIQDFATPIQFPKRKPSSWFSPPTKKRS